MTENADSPKQQVQVITDSVRLDGYLSVPPGAHGIVAFAHGSGSSLHSSRNQFVANELYEAGLATLLFDLLTSGEERADVRTREYRFDIPMLARRVSGAVEWLEDQAETRRLRVGLFGASTGAAAALIAAAEKPGPVDAVVSRGGRPDLASDSLARVQAPTLLIVGGRDTPVIGMNREAMAKMQNEVKLEIVPGATHLFQEPGALEQVAGLAARWFKTYLTPSP
jgi:putative phosphoribosyl transferase